MPPWCLPHICTTLLRGFTDLVGGGYLTEPNMPQPMDPMPEVKIGNRDATDNQIPLLISG